MIHYSLTLKLTWGTLSGAQAVPFQIEAPVTRLPHRPVRENFPHTVPWPRPFLPDHRS